MSDSTAQSGMITRSINPELNRDVATYPVVGSLAPHQAGETTLGQRVLVDCACGTKDSWALLWQRDPVMVGKEWLGFLTD